MVLFFYFLSRYLFSQFSAAKRLHCFFKFYIMNYTTKKKSDSRFTAFPLLKSCQPTLVNDTNGAFPLMKQELTKPSSLRAISMLAVFTFLFLSTEDFYVNQIAQNASSARYQRGRLLPLSAAVSVFSRSSAQRCVFHAYNAGNRLLCNPWQSCSARSSDCRRNASISGSRHPRQCSTLPFSL